MRTLLVAALAAALPILTALPATATEDDFVFLYFPHEDSDPRFQDDWGDARSGGRRHKGTDIMSEKLIPVVAVADGIVEYTRSGRGTAGNYVTLRHADGWTTWYMHLNNDRPGTDDGRGGEALAFSVEPGDFVAAGDVIGWVGDSGNAEWTSPHTHFELHRNGTAVNPYPYLADAWERAARLDALEDVVR